MSLRDRRKSLGRRPSPGVEALEGRQMLTATPFTSHAVLLHAHLVSAPRPAHVAHHVTAHAPAGHAAPAAPAHLKLTNHLVVKAGATVAGTPLSGYSPPSGAFTPAQVATAYGVNQLGASNQGQGTTIAIIDAYNDPNILADTNAFSTAFGLPTMNSSTLKVYKDQTYGAVANVPRGSGVDVETSLDVQWAHAMAPQAKILLVEVPNLSYPSLLGGIQYAAKQPGVVAVSLSYGGADTYSFASSYYSALNKYFLASGPAFNVAVTVSTGDNEFPSFPATSPNVIAVGGTSLYTSPTGVYGHETAWGNVAFSGAGGGGYSASFAPPLFQSNNKVNYLYRTIPDVSAIADPNTGVAVYDSYYAPGTNPWLTIGGTSLAAPVVAGFLDLAQQDRMAAGKPILNSTQINSLFYTAYTSPTDYATYFNDITQGNNNTVSKGIYSNPGYNAGVGYDLATGLGSPKVNKIVPYLTNA